MAKGFQKIIFGLMLGILITSFFNVGISLFMDEPEYRDYCNEREMAMPIDDQFKPAGSRDCEKKYNEVLGFYDRNAFFVLAIFGFALLIGGLFVNQFTLQVVFLFSGALNVISGVMRNLHDKLFVFIALGLLIAIGIYIIIKMVED